VSRWEPDGRRRLPEAATLDVILAGLTAIDPDLAGTVGSVVHDLGALVA
jgi:hypothetical protein